MIRFSEWMKMRESSATTRLKTQVALGLAPPTASIFGRSTPPPWQVERLTKALKQSHKKKKKRHKRKKSMSEGSKPLPIRGDFAAFISSMESLAKDLLELKTLKKKKDSERKIKSIMKKHGVEVDGDLDEKDGDERDSGKKKDAGKEVSDKEVSDKKEKEGDKGDESSDSKVMTQKRSGK